MLCKLMKVAGIPNGVVNIVFGTGLKAGEALVNHQDVNVGIIPAIGLCNFFYG